MIKTKIICTVGPAVDDPETMRSLIGSGMDVARMNFSHGSHEEHLGRLRQLRGIAAEQGTEVPVLLDTKGPEIRLGELPEGGVELMEGGTFTLTADTVFGDENRASVSYLGLPADVEKGNRILIDDGLVELTVKEVAGNEIVCEVQNGGRIGSRKSVNVPDVSLNLPSLTDGDKADVLFAIEHDYDFIAVSFVRKREDITGIGRFLEEHGGGHIKLIAKIESREGVRNIDEIIRVSDGIMVARGDLGVEIPVEEIPVVQKDMIQRCYRAGKPVITATQMLDSMIRNPRPTRAEVTDVANAVFDGTSAIMLSGETASGRYPVESLRTMQRIAETAEKSIDYWQRFSFFKNMKGESVSITSAIGHATCTTAMDLSAAAIVAVTTSGETARRISGYRPQCPIIAATTDARVLRQLRLSWGVCPVLAGVVASTDDLFSTAVDAARRSGAVRDGDIIVVTSGVPLGISGTTNMLKVQMIGNILARGKGIGNKNVTGAVRVIRRGEELPSPARGDILVMEEITDEMLPLIRLSAGVVLSGPDKNGTAETLGRALEIPILIETEGAMQMLKSGTVVNVDAKQGVVQCVD